MVDHPFILILYNFSIRNVKQNVPKSYLLFIKTSNMKKINGLALSSLQDTLQSPAGPNTATPLHSQAFDLSDAEKVEAIKYHFHEIMHILGMDMEDDSLKNTPKRVAKMYVEEIFKGINPANKPDITLFENKYGYRNMLVERNIPLQSTCEHHFQPIVGVVHIGYISSGKVIGLSKLNRLVEYFGRRPQVQERMTVQLAEELMEVLQTRDVAVYVDAKHMCVEARGVEHHGCSTVTTAFHGKFLNEQTRMEFYQAIKS
jgi:GTP cyclohydrolase IA